MSDDDTDRIRRWAEDEIRHETRMREIREMDIEQWALELVAGGWRGDGATLRVDGRTVGEIESVDITLDRDHDPMQDFEGGSPIPCPFCGRDHVGAECPKNPRDDGGGCR